MALPPVIGRYEITQRLGQGGMGAIYLARDPVIDRLVAIKLLHSELANEDLRRRFAQEARASGALSHPHIVTVHDFGEFEGAPFIVMEYIRGETLGELVKRRAEVPIADKLRWMEQVCNALAYAHQGGVIHRDIKPSNLMIDQHGTIKVLDFGIARVLGASLTKMSATIGTPAYMSPEQIESKPIDARSDVFAVGAVLYELLCYREAFAGETVPSILMKVLRDNPDPLQKYLVGAPSSLAQIVETALQKEREKRYPDMRAFEQAIATERRRLEAVVSEPTIVVPGLARPSVTPTPRRRTDPAEIVRRRAEQIRQHVDRAWLAYAAGDLDTAVAECENVLVIDQNHAEALQLLARIRENDPHSTEALLTEARSALESGDLVATERLIVQAESMHSGSTEVARLRDALRVEQQAQDARARRANAVAAAYERARTSAEQGAVAAAKRSLTEALALDPEFAPARTLQEQLENQERTPRTPAINQPPVVSPDPASKSTASRLPMAAAAAVLVAVTAGGAYYATLGESPASAPAPVSMTPTPPEERVPEAKPEPQPGPEGASGSEAVVMDPPAPNPQKPDVVTKRGSGNPRDDRNVTPPKKEPERDPVDAVDATLALERRNTAQRFTRDAQRRYEAADYDGAIASLKRALAADPANEDAAGLLKKVQLAQAAEGRRRPPND